MRTVPILLSLAFLASACGGGNTAVDIQAHEEEVVQQLTMFTDSAEFYVEYPEMVEGSETEFLVHLTGLNNYKPFERGSVRITLDFGENKSTALAEDPLRQGIWLVTLTPEYSGSCSIVFEHTGESRNEKYVFPNGYVEGLEQIPDAVDETDHAHETAPEGITFTKEQAWKSEFMVEVVKSSSFQGIIRAGGEILAMPGEKYFIHSMNTGIVNYLKKNLVAGSNVKAGENIISVEGKGLVNENITLAYEEAKTRFEQSRSEYARHMRLFRENAVSEKEFIASRSSYVTDSIRYQNLRMSYTGGGLKISSPIGGYI
ncbi:MAG TPA: hypothetical protein ENI20_02475, partial [Bacteroides sp.]|nr:hypothetical protein [Bacteroides sp.]